MPCCGDDSDDDVGDCMPKWWNRIEPLDKPDDPNSFMSKFSNVLGDTIDYISDVLMNTTVVMSGVPFFLYMVVTGQHSQLQGGCVIDPDEE